MIKIPLEILAHVSFKEAKHIIQKKSLIELITLYATLRHRRWYIICGILSRHLTEYLVRFGQLKVTAKTRAAMENPGPISFLIDMSIDPPPNLGCCNLLEMIPEELREQVRQLMLAEFRSMHLQKLLDEFDLSDYEDVSNMLLREILSRDELHKAITNGEFKIGNPYSIEAPLKHATRCRSNGP